MGMFPGRKVKSFLMAPLDEKGPSQKPEQTFDLTRVSMPGTFSRTHLFSLQHKLSSFFKKEAMSFTKMKPSGYTYTCEDLRVCQQASMLLLDIICSAATV